MNRRQIIKKVGLAMMAAIPVIVSISALKATQAQSGLPANGAACSQSTQCAAGGQDSASPVPAVLLQMPATHVMFALIAVVLLLVVIVKIALVVLQQALDVILIEMIAALESLYRKCMSLR